LAVNAQHVKKVPGRKTDVNDAEWLAMLARSGLLRGSFVPPEQLRNLRQVSRYHESLTGDLAAEKNRLVRVLSDAGIRITAVVSDAHGVAATAMIDCLLDGGTPEQALEFAGRLKAPRDELLAALEGDLSKEARFVALKLREHIRFLRSQLADLERELFAGLQPYEAAMNLLMTIPGIDQLAAARLLVEIGEDMQAFGSSGRLAKWCGVCPGNNESAGKRHSGKTTKANRYVRFPPLRDRPCRGQNHESIQNPFPRLGRASGDQAGGDCYCSSGGPDYFCIVVRSGSVSGFDGGLSGISGQETGTTLDPAA
jgi:transposase